jgi:hypothetical protein
MPRAVPYRSDTTRYTDWAQQFLLFLDNPN